MSFVTDDLRKYAGLWEGKNKLLRDNLYRFADSIDAKLEERYEALPIDADDVPICAGDKMTDGEYVFVVDHIVFHLSGAVSICNHDGVAWAACDIHHYKEPTVKDLLRTFAEEWEDLFPYERDVLLAEYEDKLKLVGEDK